MYYIYALIDPRTSLPFYIGKGKGGRKFDHLSRKQQNNKYKQHVIEQIRRDGLEPTILMIVENIEHENEAYNLEEIEIAKYGRRVNETGILTNLTSGGVGTKRTIRTEEHRKKLGWSKGKNISESHKSAISKALKGKTVSDKAKENIRISRLGKSQPDQVKSKIAESLKGRIQSDETKRKRSESLKKRYEDPELRKKISQLVKLALVKTTISFE